MRGAHGGADGAAPPKRTGAGAEAAEKRRARAARRKSRRRGPLAAEPRASRQAQGKHAFTRLGGRTAFTRGAGGAHLRSLRCQNFRHSALAPRAFATAAGCSCAMAAATPGGASSAGSTRVCVKNVPRHCTDARLREHFAARGEVTDAKILRTGCASVARARRAAGALRLRCARADDGGCLASQRRPVAPDRLCGLQDGGAGGGRGALLPAHVHGHQPARLHGAAAASACAL